MQAGIVICKTDNAWLVGWGSGNPGMENSAKLERKKDQKTFRKCTEVKTRIGNNRRKIYAEKIGRNLPVN